MSKLFDDDVMEAVQELQEYLREVSGRDDVLITVRAGTLETLVDAFLGADDQWLLLRQARDYRSMVRFFGEAIKAAK